MYGLRSIDWDDPNLDLSFPDDPNVLEPIAIPTTGAGGSAVAAAASGGDFMGFLRRNKTVVFGVAGAVLLLAVMRR